MILDKIIKTKKKDSMVLETPEINHQKTTGRVDINHLIARVRKKQNQENRSNLVFFGFFAILVLVSGILLSF